METLEDDPVWESPADIDVPPALEDFLPHIGETFTAGVPGGTVEIQLVDARPLEDHPSMGFEDSFSLLFRAPPDCPLTEGSVALDHDAAGWVVLFLVSAGEDEDGRYFEAVFN